MDVVFEIAGQEGVRVVRDPLLEGGGVVECLMSDRGDVTRMAPKDEEEVYLIWRLAVKGRPVSAGLGVL